MWEWEKKTIYICVGAKGQRGSQERTSYDPWFLVRLQRYGPHQSARVVVRVLTSCL